MLTGLSENQFSESEPWGRLCPGENYPLAAFGQPATVAEIRRVGLTGWSVRFGNGLCSDTLGWMSATASNALTACGLAIRQRSGLVIAADRLADLEQALKIPPFSAGWRNEQFALRDRAGALIVDGARGVLALERSLYRPLGLLSSSVQLNVIAPQGKVWIAQRALHKAIDPGLWDAAVAGGLPADELPLSAVRREAREEAGISSAWWPQVQYLGRLRVCRLLPDQLHHEQVWVYRLHVDAETCLSAEDGEVSRFALVSPEEILARYRAGQFNYEAACASFY